MLLAFVPLLAFHSGKWTIPQIWFLVKYMGPITIVTEQLMIFNRLLLRRESSRPMVFNQWSADPWGATAV